MCLAIPGQIIELSEESLPFATVEVSGVRRKVNVDLVYEDGLAQDDWVLIHVGFAMSKISAEQAEEQLNLLDMMGERKAALEEVQGYGEAGGDPFDPLGENPFQESSTSGVRDDDPSEEKPPTEKSQKEMMEEA